MTKDEALDLAMEAIARSGDFLFNWHDCEPNNEHEMSRYQEVLAMNEKAFTAIKQARALDKKAENARELGLDYEPAQQEPFGYFRYDLRLDAWVQNRAGLTGTPLYTSPPAQQEPVAWMTKTGSVWKTKADETDTPLYTSPPAQRTWVSLTDEQMLAIVHYSQLDNARAIEAKLKEMNT